MADVSKAVTVESTGALQLQLTPPVLAGNMTLLEANIEALARCDTVYGLCADG